MIYCAMKSTRSSKRTKSKNALAKSSVQPVTVAPAISSVATEKKLLQPMS